MIKALITLFTFIIFSLVASAQDAPKPIVIKLDQTAGIEKNEITSLRRSIIESIILAKKFELSLANFDAKKVDENKIWYEFRADVSRSNNFENDVTFKLIERPSGYLINVVKESALHNTRLQYRVRVMALKLLFGKYVNELTGELLPNPEVIPLDVYIEDKEKKINNKKASINTDKMPIPEFAVGDSELASLNRKLAEIQKANKEAAEQNAQIAKKVRADEIIAPTNLPTINSFSSPDLDLRKGPEMQEKSSPSTYQKSFSYSVGFEKESIESNIVFITNEAVDVEINIDRVYAKVISKHYDTGKNNYFNFSGMLSKNVGKNEYGVTPKVLISGDYFYDLFEQRFMVGVIGELERNGYANLRQRGEGITAISSTMAWIGVGTKYGFTLYDRAFVSSFAFKRTFIANSDIGTNGDSVLIEGSKIQAGIGCKIVGLWGLEINVEKSSFTSVVVSKLENQHFSTSLNLVYN